MGHKEEFFKDLGLTDEEIAEYKEEGMSRKVVTIGNETFEADVEMIPLLKELNRLGLRTTQHCIGHEGEGDESAYLSIAIQPDMDIGIRYDERPRLVIRWNRHNKFAQGRSSYGA